MRQNESRLRAILLDKAGTQKVSDQDVISRFLNIRWRIETITHVPIYLMDRVAKLLRKANSKEQFAFFDGKFWSQLTQDERTKRVIAKIFDFVNLSILDFQVFGAEGMQVVDDKGRGTGKYLPPGLRHVEQALEASKGTSRTILRRNTLVA